VKRVVIALALREGEELLRVGEARVDLLEAFDDAFEQAPLLAELLRALRVGPDAGIFEGLRDFYEARLLAVVVKDTSAARPSERRGR